MIQSFKTECLKKNEWNYFTKYKNSKFKVMMVPEAENSLDMYSESQKIMHRTLFKNIQFLG